MSTFKVNQKVVAIENDETWRGDTIFKDTLYTVSSTGVDYSCDCMCCGGSEYIMLLETDVAEWCPCSFRAVEPAKQKTSYRMATLEILTQFPTVKETSDQPFNVPTEKGVEA